MDADYLLQLTIEILTRRFQKLNT